jgi:hypothetical protein
MKSSPLSEMPAEVLALITGFLASHHIAKLWISGASSLMARMKHGGVTSFRFSQRSSPCASLVSNFEALDEFYISHAKDNPIELVQTLKSVTKELRSLCIPANSFSDDLLLSTLFTHLIHLDTGYMTLDIRRLGSLPPTLTSLKLSIGSSSASQDSLPSLPRSLTRLYFYDINTSVGCVPIAGSPDLLSLGIEHSSAIIGEEFIATLPSGLTHLNVISLDLAADDTLMAMMPADLQSLEIQMCCDLCTISALPKQLTHLALRCTEPTEIGPQEVAQLPRTLTSLVTDFLELLPGSGAFLPPLLRNLIIDMGGEATYPYELENTPGFLDTHAQSQRFQKQPLPSSLTSFRATDHRPDSMLPILPDGLRHLYWEWLQIRQHNSVILPSKLHSLVVNLKDVRVHDWASLQEISSEHWLERIQDAKWFAKELHLPQRLQKLSIVLYGPTPLATLLPRTLTTLRLSLASKSWGYMFPKRWGKLLPPTLIKAYFLLPSATIDDEWVRSLDLKYLLHLRVDLVDPDPAHGATPSSLSSFPKSLVSLFISYNKLLDRIDDMSSFSSLRLLSIEAPGTGSYPRDLLEILPKSLTNLRMPRVKELPKQEDKALVDLLKRNHVELQLI